MAGPRQSGRRNERFGDLEETGRNSSDGHGRPDSTVQRGIRKNSNYFCRQLFSTACRQKILDKYSLTRTISPPRPLPRRHRCPRRRTQLQVVSTSISYFPQNRNGRRSRKSALVSKAHVIFSISSAYGFTCSTITAGVERRMVSGRVCEPDDSYEIVLQGCNTSEVPLRW